MTFVGVSSAQTYARRFVDSDCKMEFVGVSWNRDFQNSEEFRGCIAIGGQNCILLRLVGIGIFMLSPKKVKKPWAA